jgi:hypothetical protein
MGARYIRPSNVCFSHFTTPLQARNTIRAYLQQAFLLKGLFETAFDVTLTVPGTVSK